MGGSRRIHERDGHGFFLLMQVELYFLGAMLRPGGLLLVEVVLGQGLSLSHCCRQVETYRMSWYELEQHDVHGGVRVELSGVRKVDGKREAIVWGGSVSKGL